jgi:hypothetical protein
MLHDLSHGPHMAQGKLDHGENQLDVALGGARLGALLRHLISSLSDGNYGFTGHVPTVCICGRFCGALACSARPVRR